MQKSWHILSKTRDFYRWIFPTSLQWKLFNPSETNGWRITYSALLRLSHFSRWLWKTLWKWMWTWVLYIHALQLGRDTSVSFPPPFIIGSYFLVIVFSVLFSSFFHYLHWMMWTTEEGNFYACHEVNHSARPLTWLLYKLLRYVIWLTWTPPMCIYRIVDNLSWREHEVHISVGKFTNRTLKSGPITKHLRFFCSYRDELTCASTTTSTVCKILVSLILKPKASLQIYRRVDCICLWTACNFIPILILFSER